MQKEKAYLRAYLKHLRIERGLSENTVSVYRRDILEFRKHTKRAPLTDTARSHVRSFLFSVAKKGNQPITRRRKQTALKSFFAFLENEGVVSSNPMNGIASPKVPEKEICALSEKETKRFLDTFKKDASRFHARNELIARIFVETGIRLSELTNLSVSDIALMEKTMLVKRKGGREQTLPLNTGLAQRLKKFIGRRVRDEPLFMSGYGRRISQRRVGMLMKTYFEKAGIQRKGLSCHSLRHGYCSRLLEKGVNLRTIQTLAGHKHLSTTERYLHIPEGQLKKDAEAGRMEN